MQFDPEYAQLFRELIEKELEASEVENAKIAHRAERRLGVLREEQEKLLRAHYAEAIPLDLMKKEQERSPARRRRSCGASRWPGPRWPPFAHV